MKPSLEIMVAAASVIFSAGGAWYAVRQTRKDCNGLGRKTGRLFLALLLIAPPEKKDELIKFFRD